MPFPIRLDSADPLPLYAQLEREIKLAVVGGRLPLGQRLPTVRQLAVDLKINANTVAKVYAELESQGVLATRRGVGTFIAALPTAPNLSRAKRIELLRLLAKRCLTEAVSQGFSPRELLEQIQNLSLSNQEKSHGRG